MFTELIFIKLTKCLRQQKRYWGCKITSSVKKRISSFDALKNNWSPNMLYLIGHKEFKGIAQWVFYKMVRFVCVHLAVPWPQCTVASVTNILTSVDIVATFHILILNTGNSLTDILWTTCIDNFTLIYNICFCCPQNIC